MNNVWTVGHSTRSLNEFTEMILRNNINILVDVRSFPGSRKFPHFNKEKLTQSIPSVGIEYVHILDLGGRRRTNKNSLNTSWRHPAFRGYADYMETDPFDSGLNHLAEIASVSRACYFCSEAVPWRCHRSMISDSLLANGWTVNHIMSATKNQKHTFTEPAKIVSGKLSYRGMFND